MLRPGFGGEMSALEKCWKRHSTPRSERGVTSWSNREAEISHQHFSIDLRL